MNFLNFLSYTHWETFNILGIEPSTLYIRSQAEGPAPSGSVPTEGGLPAERPRPVRSLGSWSSAQCLGPGALWFQLAAAFCAVVGAES